MHTNCRFLVLTSPKTVQGNHPLAGPSNDHALPQTPDVARSCFITDSCDTLSHLVTGFVAVSLLHSEMDEGTERRKVGSTEMLNNVDALALY